MNFFFFKYKTYTSFEPHLLYKQEMLQWMLYSFLIFFFFLFQWNTEVVNNQQFIYLFSYFFLNPVNTDKERKKEKKKREKIKQLHRTMKRKVNSSEVGLNVAGFYTLGLKHRHNSRWWLVTVSSHCLVPVGILNAALVYNLAPWQTPMDPVKT